MGGEVIGVDGTTLGAEIFSVYCTTRVAGTRDVRAMESLHWPNILLGSMLALSWASQVTTGTSVIAHVRLYMTWMIRSSGVRGVCVR